MLSIKSISLIIPFALLFAGSLGSTKGRWFRKAYAAGECMLLQTVAFEIIFKFAAKVPHTKAFNYLFFALTKLIGLDSSILNHDLYVRNAEQSLHFDITIDAMGIYFLLVLLIPYVFLLCIGSEKDKKSASRTVAMSVAYLMIRELALICLTFFYGSTEVYWSMTWLALSFLPFVLLMVIFTEMKQEESPVAESALNKKTTFVISGAVVSFFALCVLWTMDDPGITKSRNVLIDEWHCDGWESVEEHLDKENYGGQRSVYTYTSLVDWFRDMNMPVTINKDKELTFDLSEYKIVVLKTPQKEYTKEEIANIRKYVENGGGLFVVGDHTNLFGMSDYFNALLKEWNITFEKDATYNVETTGLSVYEPKGLFQDAIVSPMEYYKFATSCSIKSGLGVKSVITGYGLCSEQMDISHINFFNNMIPETHDKWGMFEQCVKKDVKKGRVVVWSDSTTFSSFSVFMHNNPELILGIVEYLARENTAFFAILRVLSLIAFLVFLAALIWLLVSDKESKDKYQAVLTAYGAVAIPLCLVIASFVSGKIDFQNYGKKVLNNLNDQQMVYFVTENKGDYFSNFIGDFSWNQQENYSNFFIMFQRLGLYNREITKIPENLGDSARALVVMNPTESMSKKELNNLENYVKEGGTVIVCDRGDYSDNTLLEHFDILKSGVIQSVPIDFQSEDGSVKNVTTLTQSYNAYGSWKIVDAITNDKFIDLIAYRIACGNGSIYILSDSYILSNAWLGDPGMAPTQLQYDTMNSIYDMLEKMIPMS
ncbi:MAG: hypothetical protein IKH28_10035 [Lachnospiraceae bacterium]|nr:hypothetical protein [Lachnospiraceae bacterium]